MKSYNPLTYLVIVITLGNITLASDNLLLKICIVCLHCFIFFLINRSKELLKIIIRLILPFSIMLLFIQGGFNSNNSTVLFHFAGINFGLEGIRYAVNLILVMMSFILGFKWFLYITNPLEIASSLKKVGVSKKISYIVLASLNIIPEFERNLEKITDAQQCRGINLNGNVLQRFRALVYIISPLIMSTFISSIERGVTLEARGFNYNGEKSTNYVEVSFKTIDYILISFFICFMIFIFLYK